MERLTTRGELRAEGRTLAGVVMRFGEIGDRNERFLSPARSRARGRRGSIWSTIRCGWSRGKARGWSSSDTPEALTLRAELPRIPAADVALQGVRDGTRTGLSVEFRAVRERREPQTGTRVIEAASLAGVGIVERPSYGGSRIETRQRTQPGVSGAVGLGTRLACQCRDGCDAVSIAVDAFDVALREVQRDARLIPLFFSGSFDRPLARVGEGLTLRRRGDQLEIIADGLPDTGPVRDFMETVRGGAAYQFRPYFPDRSSEIAKEGTTARVVRGDLRGIEIAPIAGPTEGLQEISIGRRRRRQRRRTWL